ncbi:MAG: hypothetical protein C0469_04205 [Cyanobacteria bacterium DS2.3.42]|nr:hypothetical protein [Cyanobacteria bacterium DS2.3.42]
MLKKHTELVGLFNLRKRGHGPAPIFAFESPRVRNLSLLVPFALLMSCSSALAQLSSGFTPNTAQMAPIRLAQSPTLNSTLINNQQFVKGMSPRLAYRDKISLYAQRKLPSRFFFNYSMETAFRTESNPFQFPSKLTLLNQLGGFNTIASLDAAGQQQVADQFKLVNARDAAFRIIPAINLGYNLTPSTRLIGNYVFIRDQFSHNVSLNTVSHSLAWGLQQDIPLPKWKLLNRASLTSECQFRELYVLNQTPLFDCLPAATLSYQVTPRLSAFANVLLQLRGTQYMVPATREIDPFYTFGLFYGRGPWTLSATALLVTNFREPFLPGNSHTLNPYAWISDFEVSRKMTDLIPGSQAFMRFEHIYNFHTDEQPGSSSVDYRWFFGTKMALGKQATSTFISQMRKQLQEREGVQVALPAKKKKGKNPPPPQQVQPEQDPQSQQGQQPPQEPQSQQEQLPVQTQQPEYQQDPGPQPPLPPPDAPAGDTQLRPEMQPPNPSN